MKLRAFKLLLILVLVLCGGWAQAANYALQILMPRAAGTAPDAGHPTINSNHRIFYAYPGILYEIQGVAIGGLKPYTYELTSGVPSGMTIDASTGVIQWTATADGTSAGPITFRVCDSESTCVTTTWTITVQASKFKFVNADYSGTESGTISQPYNTLSDTQSIGTGYIIYLRGATAKYNWWGISYSNVGQLGQFRYADYNASSKSIQFLAYPGESPVFDFGKGYEPVLYSGVNTSTDQFTTGRWGDIWATGDRVQVQARRCTWAGNSCSPVDAAGTLPSPLTVLTDYYVRRVDATHITLHPTAADATNNTNRIDITTTGDSGTLDNYTIIGGSLYLKMYGDPAYFEGIRFQNIPNKGLNFVNDMDYVMVRNNVFDTQYGGGNGLNSGMIDNEGNTNCGDGNPVHEYNVYLGNTFSNFNDSAAVKWYAQYKSVFRGNTISNGAAGTTGVVEGFALKGGCMTQVDIDHNVIHDISGTSPQGDGLAGNNHELAGGEYSYNVVYNITGTRGVRINQDGYMRNPFYYFRNSFCTTVQVRDGLDNTLAAANGLTDADAGPFYFTQNVIVNADGATGPNYGINLAVQSPAENGGNIVLTNHLAGVTADGIVDATCKLQGSYRTAWLGSRGYEEVAGGGGGGGGGDGGASGGAGGLDLVEEKPVPNIVAETIDIDRIRITALNCARIETTGRGLRRQVACIH